METLADYAQRLKNGETNAVSLVSAALAKAEAAKNVFISLRQEEALAEAEASDMRRRSGEALGALDGLPIAVKDLFDVQGTVTTAGSRVRASAPPAAADAPVIAALKRQGMIVVGKTNLSEFAFSGLGLNPHFGTPVAGFAVEQARVPGGSSSGSAIAVQRGIVAAAIGTDTAGSIRVPAAFNGLVGFKSSAARYDQRGVHPLAPTLDSLGPITRSVADCLLLDAAMRDLSPTPIVAPPLSGLRFVVDETLLLDADIEPAVRDNLRQTMGELEERGAQVERKQLDLSTQTLRLIAENGWLGAVEAWSLLGDIMLGAQGEIVDRRVRARLLAASSISGDAVARIRSAQASLMASMREALGGAILVTPTVKHVAPVLAPLESNDALFAQVNLATLSLTMVGSLLDMPGLAMPSGVDPEGLPTSILFSMSQGQDEALLHAGLAIEKALGRTGG